MLCILRASAGRWLITGLANWSCTSEIKLLLCSWTLFWLFSFLHCELFQPAAAEDKLNAHECVWYFLWKHISTTTDLDWKILRSEIRGSCKSASLKLLGTLCPPGAQLNARTCSVNICAVNVVIKGFAPGCLWTSMYPTICFDLSADLICREHAHNVSLC